MLRMEPEAVKALAERAKTGAHEAIDAANQAVASLIALKTGAMFGPSPAGKHVDQVFGLSAQSIDELVTQIRDSIDKLTEAVKASADLVLNVDQQSEADYKKAATVARSGADKVRQTGIDPNALPPGTTAPSNNDNYQSPAGATSAPSTGSTPASTPAAADNAGSAG